eukprot:gene5757-biopygen22262
MGRRKTIMAMIVSRLWREGKAWRKRCALDAAGWTSTVCAGGRNQLRQNEPAQRVVEARERVGVRVGPPWVLYFAATGRDKRKRRRGTMNYVRAQAAPRGAQRRGGEGSAHAVRSRRLRRAAARGCRRRRSLPGAPSTWLATDKSGSGLPPCPPAPPTAFDGSISADVTYSGRTRS